MHGLQRSIMTSAPRPSALRLNVIEGLHCSGQRTAVTIYIQMLQPLKIAVGSDLTTMLGDSLQANDVISTSVVPGKAYTLADLIALNGGQLMSLSGVALYVSVKQ